MRRIIPLMAFCLLSSAVEAQEVVNDGHYNTQVSGSIQSDVLVPQGKQEDGSNEDLRTNTYADVNLTSKFIDAGARFEYLEHPLPGYESDFKGWGVPYFYIKAKLSRVELTAGNFYEQFGSGFILRTYEERTLGIDNSLLGVRLVAEPIDGLRLKALAGKQRRYWAHNDGWVSGADLQFSLDRWIRPLASHGVIWTLGASWVNKHERATDDGDVYHDPTHRLRFPEAVNSWDVRSQVQKGGFSVLAEYAGKTQDPSFDNGFIYRHGYAAMLSTSYSKKGMSFLAQVKRSDNMSSRSRRQMSGTSSFINHLPAFTFEHTYTLAALYPYATQLAAGEWALQGQAAYTFAKHTPLGGRYGTKVQVNYSHVHAIDKHFKDINGQTADAPERGSDGYGSAFWKWGKQTYYQDLNIQLDKRVSRGVHLHAMYMNQLYNKTVVEGEGGVIHSDIFVLEGKYRLARRTILRTELQYLTTADDEGDWLFALGELSLAPHWMLTASDEWNVGETQRHYWTLYATCNFGSHRVQLGYVRTRRGYNCSGGVCRLVPSYQGVTLSYNYNF